MGLGTTTYEQRLCMTCGKTVGIPGGVNRNFRVDDYGGGNKPATCTCCHKPQGPAGWDKCKTCGG